MNEFVLKSKFEFLSTLIEKKVCRKKLDWPSKEIKKDKAAKIKSKDAIITLHENAPNTKYIKNEFRVLIRKF